MAARRLSAFVGLAALLLVLAGWSMGTGHTSIGVVETFEALLQPAQERADIVLWQIRLPRLLAACAAGAALSVAGAIMQAVTGNPLADPGLMGVNAGAAFAVVVALAAFGVTAAGALVWIAFSGAIIAACVVYSLGSAGRSGPTPIKLVLAGVIVATFLGALSNAILLIDAQTLDTVRFWTVGSVRGRQLPQVLPVLPYIATGIAVAMLCGGQFTVMTLGGDTARGLGQNPAVWRGLAALLVATLSGAAVALAGPVGFVGLVVPHMVRMSVGPDYRVILPFAAIGGATLAVAGDTLPRALLGPDMPVGVTMALIGAPFFIWLARRQGVPT